MVENMIGENVSHDPRHNRYKALESLRRAQEIEQARLASGKWEWVQEDIKTRVLKRKKQSNKK